MNDVSPGKTSYLEAFLRGEIRYGLTTAGDNGGDVWDPGTVGVTSSNKPKHISTPSCELPAKTPRISILRLLPEMLASGFDNTESTWQVASEGR